MRFGFCQIFITTIYVLNLGIALAKHGEGEVKKYNFWTDLLGCIITLVCLYFGGFYG